MTIGAPGPPSGVILRTSHQLVLAIACATTVANITYAQPLLDEIADSFGLGRSSAGLVITATQIGYALGLVFLVPLGDAVDPGKLVAVLSASTIVALLAAAAAPTTTVFLGCLAIVGALAVAIQLLVALAASLAPAERRGRTVGTVTSGVVVGIVAARLVAGAVHHVAGWRAVYVIAACTTAAVSVLVRTTVPRQRPSPVVSARHRTSQPTSLAAWYPRLVRSQLALVREQPVLRARALLALLTFGAFSTLWTPLVLELTAPPVSLSHRAVGLVGLAGLAGALAARPAGRAADGGRAQTTTGVALATLALAWLLIGQLRLSLWVLVLGVMLLDASVQAVHVSSQSLITSLEPSIRSRLVGGYMVFYALGTAMGSIASTIAYGVGGWNGVCVLGGSFAVTAFVVWARAVVSTSGRAHEVHPSAVVAATRGRDAAGDRDGVASACRRRSSAHR